MSLPERLSDRSSKGDRGGGTEQRRDSDGSDCSTTAAEKHLVQRCVIIQKDERGYGLTVSGDNPVYVASVKPEGAAAKAGVQKDDRIVKVNGNLVLNRNHIDVVKLIRSGSYVALTLMGKPNLSEGSQPPLSPPSSSVEANSSAPSKRNSRITAPQPVDPDIDRELVQRKVHMTQVMLEQAREDFMKQQRQYVKTPSEKLHTQLLDKERTVKTLENQLRALTGADEPPRFSDVDQNTVDSSNNLWAASLPVSSDVYSRTDSPHNSSPRLSPTPLHAHNARPDSEDPAPAHRGESAMEVDSGFGHSENTSISSTQQEIISIDDEDVNSDEEPAMETGPFSDLKLLEKKPAHLAVFLHYLISNSDPCALLFYVVTDMFKQTAGNNKDLRKWGYEIFSTFLVPTAPLRVEVNESLVTRVSEVLQMAAGGRSDNESTLRAMFDDCRVALGAELNGHLAEFRNMRAMGLGSLFGAHELLENMDKGRELKMIEKSLVPHLQYCSEDNAMHKQSDRDLAMGWALATFLRQAGVHKAGSSSSGAVLERVQSFIMKDKRSFKLGSRSAKAKGVKGHQFNLQHFYVPSQCSCCDSLIWGVGYQGFLCQNCEMGVHKQCVEDVAELCSGKKRKRAPHLIHRPRSTNPHAGAETGVQEMRSPPHGSVDTTGPASTQPLMKEDDKELAHIGTEVSVKSIMKNYQDLASPTEPGTGGDDTSGGQDRKGSTDLNRSESWKGKGDKSERLPRRVKSDVGGEDMVSQALGHIHSGSSSDTSLSNRSGESPSHSSEHVNESVTAKRAQKQYDSDLEVEELPPLKQVLGDEVSRLKVKEKKRQEVINELFHTERAHLRNLKVLDLLFNQPMLTETGVMPDLARALFPNMDEIITLHASLNRAMKERRSQSLVVGDVGDILLDRFEGESGDRFRKACAEYCRNQSFALERLKHYRRKDQRLAQFLAETEVDKLCRKLELKDHVPCQMQRLTKYPMLIENLLKYCKSISSQEYKNLERALERSKHILAYVNQAVRECQNYHKLKDMQKRLETRAIDSSSDPSLQGIKNLDLTQHKLVFDGPLVWRLRSQSHGGRLIDLQVVLLENLLVLLQRGDGDRLVLKCQSTSTSLMPQGGPGGDFKYTHSPVLKLQNLLARDVATDKKAFFVINTSDTGPQIYELVAQTQDARKMWCRLINEWAENQKKALSKTSGARSMMPQVLENPAESAEMFRVRDRIIGASAPASSPTQAEEAPPPAAPSSSSNSLRSSVDTAECQASPLVQPDQVSVSGAITAEAQPVLTPIERLRRNDRLLEEALTEKEAIVAEILQISPSDYRRLIQEVGSGGAGSLPSDTPTEGGEEQEGQEQGLIVSCIDSNNRLIQLLSAQASAFALGVNQPQGSETGSGTAAGLSSENGSAGSSQLRQSQAQLAQGAVSQTVVNNSVSVPMPVNQLQTMAVEMNKILSTLMCVLEVKEEERHTLRSQLEGAQKQLDMLKTLQQQILSQQQPSVPPPLPPRAPTSSIPTSPSASASTSPPPLLQESHTRPLSFVSVASSSVSEAGVDGEGEDVTDSEPVEDDSGSVLNMAHTQELPQEVVVETPEEATVAGLEPQLMAVATSHDPLSTPGGPAPLDEDSDDEPYQMIPENLPLPDDNCVTTSQDGAFPSSPLPAPLPSQLTEEEEEDNRGAGAGQGPPSDSAPMVTDLDEAGEDAYSTPTPSPTSPHDGGGEEQDDRDSAGTIEDDRDDDVDDNGRARQTGEGECGETKEGDDDDDNNDDHVRGTEEGEAAETASQGPPLSGDQTLAAEEGGGRKETAEDPESDDGGGENNNRTCQDSELTNPIEI